MPMMDSKLYDKVQQPSKSTHIVPVKGTFNVETVDKFSDDETILSSPDRTYVNRSPIDQKEFFSRNNNSDENVDKIRSEYEYKMSIMQNHIKQLQDKLEEKNDRSMDSIDRELLDQLQKKDEEDQRVIRQMEEQYKKLDDKYQTLKQDYNKQQEAVREVKRETREMIEELKRMAKTNEELMLEKDEADKEIKTLRDQVKEWQIKYEKVRLELRSVKVSSINCNMIKDNFIQPTKKGVITYDHILSFQTSIDELLITARSSYPANVIQAMKVIVSVCKLITEQVENNESRLTSDSKQTLYELKSRFSTALSDLLIAAKHHANGMGISPVSLLDHSAGNLSAVVVDLVRLVGIKDTDSNNQKSFQNDYSSNTTNSNSPPSLSQIRSQLKDTDDNYNLPEQTYITPAELTKYLKNETDTIVQTIQSLLSALRLPQNGEVYSIITSLIKIISTIIDKSSSVCSSPSGYAYTRACRPILNELDQCSQRLSLLQKSQFISSAVATANAKRDLAKEAYEIAKYTKELINLFETD
ncbi:hypothetical protein RMATCC62417_12106 [Rhizopus microsporus]|nr:hypothetical protein RMATCC62417_12106 [Rhizopus microsporus]